MVSSIAESRVPRIGEVYAVQFSGTGSVQSGLRPGVVFQNNTGNRYSPNVIVLPMTTSIKKRNMPTHVFLPAADTGLLKDSLVLCENPQCVPKECLGRYLTTLPAQYMGKIAAASLLATSAIAFIDPCSMESIWRQAVSLNEAS